MVGARTPRAEHSTLAKDGESRRSTVPAQSVFERRFGLFATGIVCLWTVTQVLEFSLTPPSYKGLSLTTPFFGLHAWNSTIWPWGARNHVKYGLGYTKGYFVLACGDSPLARPEVYISHPQLNVWMLAGWMWLFGTTDVSVRLYALVLSVLSLPSILLILRRLYGSKCALLSTLILTVMPMSGFFGFEPLMVLFALWALYRYLQLTERISGQPEPKGRYLVELALALFLMIQWSWVGPAYVFALGIQFVAMCVTQRRIQWRVLTAIGLGSVLSLGLSLYMMLSGFQNNMAVEAANKPPLEIRHDVKGITWRKTMTFGPESQDTAWGLLKALYQWRAKEGERGSFEWNAWTARNLEFASTNFTPAVLLLVGAYLVYLVVVPLVLLCRRLLAAMGALPPAGWTGISHPFTHFWFFFLSGVSFLLAFRGLMWVHQYWQSPLAPLMAIGAALGILALGDLFGAVNRLLGKSVVAILIVMLTVFCNAGLAEYRAVRWHSPKTIELFKQLHDQVPPDKALLTFKNYIVVQSRGKTPHLRPEFVWYLDRDMVMANAWQYDIQWARAARIDEIADRTVAEIKRQAQTGHFAYYHIPAREVPDVDPFNAASSGSEAVADDAVAGVGASQWDLLGWQGVEKQNWLTSLSSTELDRRLNDGNGEDDRVLFWEKHRRYREAVIAKLKTLYSYEYYDNHANRGDEDFDRSGNTPCYVFDLTHPKVE